MSRERVSREERMSEIQEKLEAGVREIFESGKYEEYIAAMSKFPHYSINNCILIVSQCPEASHVCGFRKWQTDFHCPMSLKNWSFRRSSTPKAQRPAEW